MNGPSPLLPPQTNVLICNNYGHKQPPNVTDRDIRAALHLFVSICNRKTGFLSLNVTDQDKKAEGKADDSPPLLPFLFVNIERLHVPSLGAHDVADQAQKEADARGIETVL